MSKFITCCVPHLFRMYRQQHKACDRNAAGLKLKDSMEYQVRAQLPDRGELSPSNACFFSEAQHKVTHETARDKKRAARDVAVEKANPLQPFLTQQKQQHRLIRELVECTYDVLASTQESGRLLPELEQTLLKKAEQQIDLKPNQVNLGIDRGFYHSLIANPEATLPPNFKVVVEDYYNVGNSCNDFIAQLLVHYVQFIIQKGISLQDTHKMLIELASCINPVHGKVIREMDIKMPSGFKDTSSSLSQQEQEIYQKLTEIVARFVGTENLFVQLDDMNQKCLMALTFKGFCREYLSLEALTRYINIKYLLRNNSRSVALWATTSSLADYLEGARAKGVPVAEVVNEMAVIMIDNDCNQLADKLRALHNKVSTEVEASNNVRHGGEGDPPSYKMIMSNPDTDKDKEITFI